MIMVMVIVVVMMVMLMSMRMIDIAATAGGAHFVFLILMPSRQILLPLVYKGKCRVYEPMGILLCVIPAKAGIQESVQSYLLSFRGILTGSPIFLNILVQKFWDDNVTLIPTGASHHLPLTN